MGRIAKLLQYLTTSRRGVSVADVKVAPGGGETITAEHFGPAGDDSQPLAGDFVALTGAAGSGRETAVGYLDPANELKAGPGEKRTYARFPGGAVVSEIWQKSDGTIVASNAAGSWTLEPSGNIDLNGVIIDPSGNMTVPTSLTLNGKELAEHDHPAGTPPGDTGPNN